MLRILACSVSAKITCFASRRAASVWKSLPSGAVNNVIASCVGFVCFFF